MGLTVFGDIRLEEPGPVGQADGFDGSLNVKGNVDAQNVHIEGNFRSRFGGAILADRLTSSSVDVAKRAEDPEKFPTPEICARFGKAVLVHGNVDAQNVHVEGNFRSRFGGAILADRLTSSSVDVAKRAEDPEKFPRPEICARFGKDVLVHGMVETLHMRANGNISASGNVNAQTGTVNTKDLKATGNISAKGTVSAANITLPNADCAEEFQVDATAPHLCPPGTVMVLADEGRISPSRSAYDKRVAGVVSGGGGYKPGIILDRDGDHPDRIPVALMGKVCCNVDASFGSIEIGDLLTTSDTPGYAMKVSDASRAFGAVIGKALRPLREGKALLPILVALQ
jgi:hypothetical protein